VSERAVSAKRGRGSFGAKSAQSETPGRAAAKRRPRGGGRSEKMRRSATSENGMWCVLVEGSDNWTLPMLVARR